MRVFVITQDEPIYAPRYLDALVTAAGSHDVIGVTALAPGGKAGFVGLVRERWRMYGPRDFTRAGILFIRSRLAHTVSRVARRHGIAMLSTTSVNSRDYLESLRALDVDVLVSIAANQLFKSDLLSVPKVAAVNVHSALLPNYRGLDGLFWALAHGETRVGVTAHLMNEEFDEGAILGQVAFDVPKRASLHELYLVAIDNGARLLGRVLDELAAGTSTPMPNDVSAGSYFSHPTPAAVRDFRRLGHRFFP